MTALSNNKFRTSCDQATLQRLISEQHKIILGGKIVPTVPGQHAQGVTFVSFCYSCEFLKKNFKCKCFFKTAVREEFTLFLLRHSIF